MIPKRKRGCNYTAHEINTLLNLFQHYHSAIEDKRTATIYLVHKRDAWERISAAYNAVATSGVRTVEQLKVFYDNQKQKARKSLVQYSKEESVDHQSELSLQNVSVGESETSQEEQKIDIDNWSENGGGSWCSSEPKVSPIINQQATPPSSYNSANECLVRTRRRTINRIKKKPDYKQMYFKLKCRNAYLKRRKLQQDIRLRQREHAMFTEEHNLKLSILQKEQEQKLK